MAKYLAYGCGYWIGICYLIFANYSELIKHNIFHLIVPDNCSGHLASILVHI